MKRQHLLVLIPLVFCFGQVQAERREFTYGVAAEIDTSGHVVSADLKATNVDDAFAQTVEGLVKQWQFHPAMASGAPATVSTTLTARVIVDIDAGHSAKVTAHYLGHDASLARLRSPPGYPQAAMRSKASAEVAVIATVNVEGKPVKVELYSLMMNIDDARLSKRFAAESMSTIGTWQFQPELVNGKPVTSRVIVPIKFSIKDGPVRDWKWIVKPPPESEFALDFDRQQPVALGNATGLELTSDGSQG